MMNNLAKTMKILALAVLPLGACASQKQGLQNDRSQKASTVKLPLSVYDKSESARPLESRTNELAQAGKSFHSVLEGAVESHSVKETFDFLDKLSFGNEEVKLHIADSYNNSIGDVSFFYIGEEDGGIGRLYENLCAEPSAEAAWQIYLLKTSSNVMPVFWHGGYIVRDFIFNEAALNDLEAGFRDNKPLQGLDLSGLSQANLLLPEVKMSSDGREADVYCTYWNDWGGLKRDHLHISFLKNGKVELTHDNPLTLVEYDCGICF